MTVLRSATSRLAYWTGVSPPRPFFGRSSLYSRRPAGLSEQFSVPCSFARRLQDIESDTGYDTRRRPPDSALALYILNDRLRHMLIGSARVSEADGSQSRDRPRGGFRPLPSPSRTDALRRLRFATALRVTVAADRACARPCFQRANARNRPGNGAAQFGQIRVCQRANYLRFSIRFGARKLRGNEDRSDVGTFDVSDGHSAVRVVRHLDDARDAGVMEHGCNRQATTVSTIGPVALPARFPGRNGTEREKFMNDSQKDLTSSASFDAAILSRAEAMTAPRLREQRRPPSPPDRRPPRPGGPPSSQTASAAARSAGFARLAAAALLALVGGLALPAQAQTVTTLLSNLEQVWTEGNGTNVSSVIVFAQGFTTGSNADGYHLSSIELNVERVPNTPADVTIALWSATSDSRPDASVATLTHSTGTWTTGLNSLKGSAHETGKIVR